MIYSKVLYWLLKECTTIKKGTEIAAEDLFLVLFIKIEMKSLH